MTPFEWVLLILAIAASVWQLVLFTGWYAMVRSGKYDNVTVGYGPGLVAVVLFILVVLL